MAYVIGLDVGGTTIKGGVFAGSTSVAAEIRIRTYEKNNERDEILSSMVRAIEQLKQEAHNLKLGELEGIGIGVPGFVKSSIGVVSKAVNIGLIEVNVKKWIEAQVGVPCVVQGDARTGAFAEHLCGAAKGVSSLLYVVLGTGVGSGVILDGHIHEGEHSLSGEIGHTIIDPDGKRCACGKRGCLETMASGPSIVEAYLEKGEDGLDVSSEDIARLAMEGDPSALEAYADAARALAVALSNYCTVVDPAMVVVGGGVSLAGTVLFSPLREFFALYAPTEVNQLIPIVPAMLGDRSGIIGASLLANQFLKIGTR